MADGLGLGRKGDGSLGLGQATANEPVTPSDQNKFASRSTILDFEESPVLSGLAVLGEFGAGFQGREGPVSRANKQLAANNKAQRDALMQSLQLGQSLARSANSLSGPRKETFVNATLGTLTEAGDERTARLFQSLSDAPERSIAVGGLESTSIGQSLLQQDPTGATLIEFASTDRGIELMDQIVDSTITPMGVEKISGITTQLDKLIRDGHVDKAKVEAAQKDGKISVPEIRSLIESMPKGHPLKLSQEELSAVTNKRNLDGLRAVGISLAEDFEPEAPELRAGENIVDSNGNFVGVGVFDPAKGNLVQMADGELRPLKEGEREIATTGSVEDTGLVKAVTKELQQSMISTANRSDSLRKIISQFDEKFLTVFGKAELKALSIADKTGIPLSDDKKATLSKFTQFKAESLDNLNQYIKEITGAAMTNAEADRLRKAMPDPENDSPTEFVSKLDNIYNKTLIIRQRAMQALDQGIPATTIPISEIESQIVDGTLPQNRFEALVDKGLSEKEAMKRVQEEFPKNLLEEAAKRRRNKKKPVGGTL